MKELLMKEKKKYIDNVKFLSEIITWRNKASKY
jgi:hypothetical protein